MEASSEPESELSAEQLQDLVVAIIPSSEAEAMFLGNLLEDSGIPNSTEADRTGYGALTSGGYSGTRIYVPRVLQEKARELIAEALAKVKKGRIEDAFEPESVVESLEDKKADPLMLQMAQLRDQTPEKRNEILARHIVEWQSENMSAVDMARFLAAAGLNKEDADALLAAVVRQRGEEIQSAANGKIWSGIAAIMLGLIWLGLKMALYADHEEAAARYGRPSMVIIFGFVLILIGSNTKPRSSLNDDK